MSSTNKKATDYRKDDKRLAGGYGPFAAKQNPEALLRRSVMANLLWENLFYEDGVSVVDNIRNLIPQVDKEIVYNIAIEARTKQKLRHVPLLIAREMARHTGHRSMLGDLLPQIILRADELTEFLALYWQDGKCPISKQVKKGLAKAFDNFDAYQFAKYNRKTEIRLRDVMFMVHPKPSQERQELYSQIANDTLPVPDTWEVALSSGSDKKEAWTRLIEERKLGALAFIRNLRNMEEARVDHDVILSGFENINPGWLLPLNYLAAAKHAPRYEKELEELMLRGLSQMPKLPGTSIIIVDVSGSMDASVSSKSLNSRLDAAAAMTMLAMEICEHPILYATAGNDYTRIHHTKFLPSRRGFAVTSLVTDAGAALGGGGIFTRQCLEYIRDKEQETPNRIIIFSDSQDCDHPNKRTPNPFGERNYIIDVSAHSHGIAYNKLWDAEISGWSEHFLSYITAIES